MNNKLVIEYHKDSNAKSEGLRCTSMKGAERIMRKRNKSSIASAVFTDSNGHSTNLKLSPNKNKIMRHR